MRRHLSGGALDCHLTDAHRRTIEQGAGRECLETLIDTCNHRTGQR